MDREEVFAGHESVAFVGDSLGRLHAASLVDRVSIAECRQRCCLASFRMF